MSFKKNKWILLVVFIVFLIVGFLTIKSIKVEEFNCGETVFDFEKNEYKTIKIGDQCWFAENLRSTVYRNGEEIGEAINHIHADESWNNEIPAYTWYNYLEFEGKEEEYVEKYGYLYNWYVVNYRNVKNDDGYSVCPEGWTVPSHDDWTKLERFICEDSQNPNCEYTFPYNETKTNYHGVNEGDKLKSKEVVAGKYLGTDNYGFNAYLGGIRYPSGSFHNPLGINTGWWTSTERGDYAWARNIYDIDSGIGRFYQELGHGYPVRCIKK